MNFRHFFISQQEFIFVQILLLPSRKPLSEHRRLKRVFSCYTDVDFIVIAETILLFIFFWGGEGSGEIFYLKFRFKKKIIVFLAE